MNTIYKTIFKQRSLFFVLFIILFFLQAGISSAQQTENYYRGRVVNVEDLTPRDETAMELEQRAEVQITSGPHAGRQVEVQNHYSRGRPYLDLYVEKNMEVILVAYYGQEELEEIYLFGPARDRGLMYLAGLFLVMLILVGGLQGVKTIVTLIISALILAKVMLPLILAGHSPIPVAVVSAGFIIIFILAIIGGLNAKSFSAIIGTFIGVIVAGIVAFIIGEMAHLTGFSSQEAQMLAYSDFGVDVRGLLFAGIIIGSLGAVTDVSMSVASAAERMRVANPQLPTRQLFSLSFDVGRDIMGTMANTLILAYVGAAVPLLLIFMSHQPQWAMVLNLDLIATEMVRGLAGSLGLIISIPATAYLSSRLIGRKHL